jgi:uncharacterized membrane protein
MNNYPPAFRGRGLGYGPMADHFHQTDPALAWATFALVLLLVLAFAAVLVARSAGRGRRGPGPYFRGRRPDALEVLRMRFASGQMSRDEFLQAAGDLTAAAPTIEQPPPPAA